ncbi:MAG: type I-C CRISPR-associated protein Cas8c/Csd1 [Pseudomonadota bacterium]
MILQALQQYYERKTVESPGELPPYGYEDQAIEFVIEIDKDGDVVQVADNRFQDGSGLVGKLERVPQPVDRTGQNAWKTAFLLWDHPRYALGLRYKDESDDKMGMRRIESFRQRIRYSFPNTTVDEGVSAVWQFLEKMDLTKIGSSALYDEIQKTQKGVAFRLSGDIVLVCQRPAVQGRVAEEFAVFDNADITGPCLITGNIGPVVELHRATPVPKSKSTAKIVSYNEKAYESYGKTQGLNACVGRPAAFAYTTALNHLLRRSLRVGDAATIFWATRHSDLEQHIVDIFGEPRKDNPDSNTRAVVALYKSVDAGLLNTPEGNTRFYVLGLAPNAARIAVRFWEVATVAELAVRICQHFDDLAIVHRDSEPPHLSLFRLLVSTATLGKADNIPPNLAGNVMSSILTGLPYPQPLLTAAVRRIRAEQSKKEKNGKRLPNVTYPRAALIKAYINRVTRHTNPDIKEELKMSLDESNTNVGYRLGRLFAVLEKIQEDSARPAKINATIRDTSYSAASATPVSVFSRLIRLSNNHLSKLRKGEYAGMAVIREKQIQAVIEGISDFPASLSLADQGRFAIGYYHQRNSFFKKHDNDSPEGS